jgi:hypothetical protein
MALQDIAASLVKGFAGAAGNPQAAQDVGQWQQRRSEQKAAPGQMSIQAHALAVNGLRQKLAGIDPQKDPQGYQQTVDAIQQNIHAMREIVNPDQQLPAGEWLKTHLTDRMHITNHDQRVKQLQQRQAQGVGQDQQTAAALAQGSYTPNPFQITETQMRAAGFTEADIQDAKRRQTGLVQKGNFRNIQGPSGERATIDVNKDEIPPGWTLASTSSPTGKLVQVTGPDGKPMYAMELGGKFYDQENKVIPDAKPYQKPPQATASNLYTNLSAKKLLADRRQGPPLTNEESAQLEAAKGELTLAGIARANAFAQAAAANNLIAVTDPNTGMDTLVTRAQAVRQAGSGQPVTPGVVGAPTAHDKQTQMYAISGLHRLREMRQIVKSHPEIFGPVGGRTTKANVWLGSQSPDAQKFLNDAQFLAEHSTAVFGGRAASTVAALQRIQSDPKTNPDALLAGFDSDEATLKDFTTAGGRLPEPKESGSTKPIVQHSKSTGQYRYSMDGGKTWQPGKPPSQ